MVVVCHRYHRIRSEGSFLCREVTFLVKVVKFALNALNKFNSNTIFFFPELPIFFKCDNRKRLRGAKGERQNGVDTYMNSMSSTIENGLQRQGALPHFFTAFHTIFTEFNSHKIKNFKF